MLKVCCSVSQCVVVRCRVGQFVAECCSVLLPPKHSWSEIFFMHSTLSQMSHMFLKRAVFSWKETYNFSRDIENAHKDDLKSNIT